VEPQPMSRSELFDRLRRRWARYEFRVSAEVRWNSTIRWGRITNISRGGVFIELPDPPRVGTHFLLRLALNEPLLLKGVVRRIAANRDGIGASILVGEKEKGRFEALLVAIGEGADRASAGARLSSLSPPRAMVAAAGAGS